MSEGIIEVRMHDPLLREATLHARRAGLSLDDWLLAIASEQILHAGAFERFFSRAAEESDGRVMMEILDSGRDNPPEPGDELPEGYVSSRTRS